MTDFWQRHADLVSQAVDAARTRVYWSAFPETPSGKIYGETAKADGDAAYALRLGKRFDFGKRFDLAMDTATFVGDEHSPFGRRLDVTYPQLPVESLIEASGKAAGAWAAAAPTTRVGVCAEILVRLNKASFEIANAVMNTTGQAFPMAFQAGGPHAQDRGLEAVAYAHAEMARVPAEVRWEKPQGRGEPLRLDKQFRIVPRGIALVIGCATFPTWNSYPGLFASLATGNTVIVKPHPAAILPLAITVEIARAVLAEAGFSPDVVLLAPDTIGDPVTQDLALHPEVAIIDFTGGQAFGRWLREHAGSRLLFTEEAGVNSVVIDGTNDFKGMCDNLAFSLSLYSGQMCTAPQNLFVPDTGIETDEGRKSADEVAQGIADAVDRLLSDSGRAGAVLGAVQNPATLARIAEARTLGRVVRDSVTSDGPPRTATPLIVMVAAKDEAAYLAERFGPIAFVVRTPSTDEALWIASRSARTHGAITAAVYATDPEVLRKAEDAFAHGAVSLSANLVGGIFVNQSAAFSDYHVTGGNPAGNACLTDSAFVANRFRVAAVRRLAA